MSNLGVAPGYCRCGCGTWVGFWAKNDRHLGRIKGEPKQYARGHGTRGKRDSRPSYAVEDYNIDQLETGDVVTLEDRSGETYEYEVSEIFVVDPNAEWVVDPVRDRDMVTLQSCTYPTYENRIIVRADRV